jgi:hypothetical protein
MERCKQKAFPNEPTALANGWRNYEVHRSQLTACHYLNGMNHVKTITLFFLLPFIAMYETVTSFALHLPEDLRHWAN